MSDQRRICQAIITRSKFLHSNMGDQLIKNGLEQSGYQVSSMTLLRTPHHYHPFLTLSHPNKTKRKKTQNKSQKKS